jgi:hypothetical protein
MRRLAGAAAAVSIGPTALRRAFGFKSGPSRAN